MKLDLVLSMSTLFEQLAQIKPKITSEQVAVFRSCLAAISQRVETEPISIALSLQEWGQWLEDEGYGRDEFTAILQQICEAELGEFAATTLLAFAQSMATANDGIPCVLEHVQTDYPGLEQRMAALEALAHVDEDCIGQMAGGMSKTGRIIAGTVGGSLLVGVGILAHQYWKGNRERAGSEIEERAGSEIEERLDTQYKPVGIKDGVITRGEGYEDMLLNDAVREEQRAETDLRNYRRFVDRQAEMIRYDDNIGSTFHKIDDFKNALDDRSVKYDLKAYGEAEFTRLSDSAVKDLKELIAKKLTQDLFGFGDELTARENKFFSSAKRNDRGTVNLDELIRQAGFDSYAKDRFIFEKIAPLLTMNDKEFSEFRAQNPYLAKESVEDIGNIGEIKTEQSMDRLASALIETEIRGAVTEAENVAGRKLRDLTDNYIESEVGKVERKAENEVEIKLRDSVANYIEPELIQVEEKAETEVERSVTKAVEKSEALEEDVLDDLL